MSVHPWLSVIIVTRTARSRLISSVLGLSLATIVLGWSPAPARADLVLLVENTTASAGGVGAFDVTLLDTGGTFNVSGFSVGLSVDPSSGVTFTGVDANTKTAPYIFGTVQLPPLSNTSFPSTSLIAADSDNTAPFSVTLNPGDVFGLADVSYAVAAGTHLGPIVVSINPDPSVTQIDDVSGNLIPFTPVNGTITVVPVPEPSSLALAAVGVGMAVLAARRGRAKALAVEPGA